MRHGLGERTLFFCAGALVTGCGSIVSFRDAIGFLVGCVIGRFTGAGISWVVRVSKSRPYVAACVVGALTISAALAIWYLFAPGPVAEPDIGYVGVVKKYSIVARPDDDSLEVFRVEEFASIEPTRIARALGHGQRSELDYLHLERIIRAKREGFGVKGVDVRILDPKAPEYAAKRVFGIEGGLARLDLSEMNGNALVDGLPEASFYSARYASEKPILHNHRESVAWSLPVGDRERGAAFSFVYPPFLRFRGGLEPFLELRSMSDWVDRFLPKLLSHLASLLWGYLAGLVWDLLRRLVEWLCSGRLRQGGEGA